MTFTPAMRKGIRVMTFATIFFTGLSILFLWHRARGIGVEPWDFYVMAFIVAIVWGAIGAVMTFYIVMILYKNDKKKEG